MRRTWLIVAMVWMLCMLVPAVVRADGCNEVVVDQGLVVTYCCNAPQYFPNNCDYSIWGYQPSPIANSCTFAFGGAQYSSCYDIWEVDYGDDLLDVCPWEYYPVSVHQKVTFAAWNDPECMGNGCTATTVAPADVPDTVEARIAYILKRYTAQHPDMDLGRLRKFFDGVRTEAPDVLTDRQAFINNVPYLF